MSSVRKSPSLLDRILTGRQFLQKIIIRCTEKKISLRASAGEAEVEEALEGYLLSALDQRCKASAFERNRSVLRNIVELITQVSTWR